MQRTLFLLSSPENTITSHFKKHTLQFLVNFVLLLVMFSPKAIALDNENNKALQDTKVKQTFLSCAIITSEHLTALQLYQRGLPRQLAMDSLPGISRDGKKRLEFVYDLAKRIGILNAYADINTNFARCATLVYELNGKPAPDLKEYAYYFCAGENKIRYEIILKLDRNFSFNEITNSLPSRYYDVVRTYTKLIENEGVLAAFDLTANNLKACLQQIE
jgi:hypothetical protein